MQEFVQFITTNREILIIISLWDVMWKGFGLWRASQNKAKGWFVAILVLNTVGVVPIVYLILDKYKKK
ncbi:DUF5652 family protein [Patescibacteria group bacterium]